MSEQPGVAFEPHLHVQEQRQPRRAAENATDVHHGHRCRSAYMAMGHLRVREALCQDAGRNLLGESFWAPTYYMDCISEAGTVLHKARRAPRSYEQLFQFPCQFEVFLRGGVHHFRAKYRRTATSLQQSSSSIIMKVPRLDEKTTKSFIQL